MPLDCLIREELRRYLRGVHQDVAQKDPGRALQTVVPVRSRRDMCPGIRILVHQTGGIFRPWIVPSNMAEQLRMDGIVVHEKEASDLGFRNSFFKLYSMKILNIKSSVEFDKLLLIS